jgi:argininosuccinate lyase
LIVMKGLPLAYSKDMQEDKEPVFAAADALALSLEAMSGMIADLRIDRSRMRAAAEGGYATATDLADWLVRTLGLPFREAHHICGRLVKTAEAEGVRLDQLSLTAMRRIEPRITRAVFRVLSVDQSVKSRKSFGGTAPKLVRRSAATARQRYL